MNLSRKLEYLGDELPDGSVRQRLAWAAADALWRWKQRARTAKKQTALVVQNAARKLGGLPELADAEESSYQPKAHDPFADQYTGQQPLREPEPESALALSIRYRRPILTSAGWVVAPGVFGGIRLPPPITSDAAGNALPPPMIAADLGIDREPRPTFAVGTLQSRVVVDSIAMDGSLMVYPLDETGPGVRVDFSEIYPPTPIIEDDGSVAND